MNIICSILAALFLLSAAVQYNDPDPIGWMAIYLLAAAACILYIRRKGGAILPVTVGVAALAWLLMILPDDIATVAPGDLTREWEMKNERIELARECGGLAIVIASMTLLTIASIRRTRTHPPA